MNNFDNFSDDELKDEIARRDLIAKEERLKEIRERQRCLKETLTFATIFGLAPRHGRTNCSDENLANGFGSNGAGKEPLCNRCALLQLARKTADPEAMGELFVNISFSWM